MIPIKNTKDLEAMRKSCRIVTESLNLAESLIRPGVRAIDVDNEIANYILSKGARPAFKGFNGFPANICISIDHQVVHGIPQSHRFKEGEIVGVDIGVELDGYYGDAARTFAVGEVSVEKKRLMKVTFESLMHGIAAAKKGNRLYDISHAVQKHVERAGFSVVRDLVGHGIGRAMHEPPQIPNYGKPNMGPKLQTGMVLAIEPMVNMGGYEVKTETDNWTVVTVDGRPSAHFEHNVLITNSEPEILTN